MSGHKLLTPFLLEAIQRGEAILFLGAGACIGARGDKGETAPNGDQLRDIICDRFLGGSLKSKPLSQVAELAKNEASLPVVQELIKTLFFPIRPVDFHLLIPLFRWYAIVTTNYDLVLERAYDQCKERQQILAPILRDGDRFSEKLRDPSQVLYLKLHGCITHTTDENLPLILASEEYAKHRKNRERLFRHFQDWARERPVIFCGYDIGDPNVQQILFNLADLGVNRPPYAVINSGLDEIIARYWISKRFTVFAGKFEDFLRDLDAAIPRATRGLAALVRNAETSVHAWMKTHVSPTTGLLKYQQDELQHVHKGMPTTGVNPKGFYSGLTVDWGVFQQDLDVRRRVADDVIIDAVLDSSNKTKSADAYLLKGHAGSGKSVTLRRIAWDVAHEYDGLIFFLKEGGLLRREYISELYTLTSQRLFIAIDDAIPHVADILATLGWAEKTKVPITLLLGARTNEWNVYAGELESRIEEEYELRDLTEREISQLLDILARHKALGRLTAAAPGERHEHFRLTAERQLLVALHDLSADKPFEEIVYDEYKNVVPQEARILYLDVCTLHRLGIGVRAGLISRISGITFDHFMRDFFRPLEHVTRTYFDHATRDNMYRSRHALIADMVFKQALPDPVERANQIIRIIRNMDVDYSSDEAAFREIIRGRVLAELFANKAIVLQIFDAAHESGAPTSTIEHQRAVFELHHQNGDLHAALAAIEKAEAALEHVDRSVLHTKAAVLRSLALKSSQRLVRDKLREEAKSIIRKHMGSSRVSHPYHTTGQILIDELKEKLQELSDDVGASRLKDRAVAELIRQAEQVIFEGLQRFPSDSFLLTLEAALARILDDEKRASSALERAFDESPGRSFVAVRLAYALKKQGKGDRAIEVLKRSLAENPTGKETHLAFAKILMSEDEDAFRADIAYHLKRSFTPGDSNLDAQYWFARHNFLYGDRELALSTFRSLSDTWIPAEYRNRVKGHIKDKDGSERRLWGSIRKLEESYCYVGCPDLRTDVFAHMSDFDEEEWPLVSVGAPVTFILGFTFRGPRAQDVRLK